MIFDFKGYVVGFLQRIGLFRPKLIGRIEPIHPHINDFNGKNDGH